MLFRSLSLDSDIPDHQAFPAYSPSFTLDVPCGNMPDENTEEYLQDVESRFGVLSAIIRAKASEV